MKPLTISVVTPTYNQAQFIGQTIESVLNQEGDFYIDYIIVNDGSTDNTLEVVKKYEELLRQNKFPIKCEGVSYRYWTKKNGGPASAINEGLRKAKGETLAWICSDDYYMPGIFEKVAGAFARDRQLDFLYGDSLKIYADGRPPKTEPKPRPDETFESLRTRGNSFGFNFFSKKIVAAVGYFDETLECCWDLDQWFRIFKVGKTTYLPTTIGAFRVWEGSKTYAKQEKFAYERKLLAKRYGGNIVSPHTIYAWRAKTARILDTVRAKTPRLYRLLKQAFYTLVDRFKYTA